MSPSPTSDRTDRGYIIPIGGAEEKLNNPEILDRFVDVCGGKDARIGIIPTASELEDTGRNYEKLFRRLGRELPYGITVEIEQFRRERNIIHIHALIWVERQSQKAIVIGRQGRVLKEVGREARTEIESLLDSRVNLKLWVKVKEGWADDERALHSLGYRDDG